MKIQGISIYILISLVETDTHTETKALNDVAKTSLSANQGCRQAAIKIPCLFESIYLLYANDFLVFEVL